MKNITLCSVLTTSYRYILDGLKEPNVLFIILVLSILGFFYLNIFNIMDYLKIDRISGIGYYDYSLKHGPHSWKQTYPSACGNYQSPINIMSEETSLLPIHEPLLWNHYDEIPIEIFIRNTGHTVELKANFACNIPTLNGADLLESYSFLNLCFRWSILDDQGSEHSINNKKYPMELQVSHVSRDNCQKSSDVMDLGILVLSYFFSITKNDNPYLDPIVLNLRKIRKPGLWVQIPSFPISWLCFNFRTNFYSYGGSLTEPPCSEGVTWLIYSEPMALSLKQLSEFRSLLTRKSMKILKNSRPIQNLNSRIVCLNRYIGYDQETEDEEMEANRE